MNLRLLAGILLAVGAAAAGWALWNQRDGSVSSTPETLRSAYVLEDFELIALDEHGKESFTLRAPQLQQTPGGKTIDVSTPVFLLPDATGQPWRVRAHTAWIDEARTEIRLRGEVVANSPQGEPAPVTMTTEELNVFPRTRQASSAVAVTVTQPGLTMQGTGMQADLVSRDLELLSNIHTTYAPNR